MQEAIKEMELDLDDLYDDFLQILNIDKQEFKDDVQEMTEYIDQKIENLDEQIQNNLKSNPKISIQLENKLSHLRNSIQNYFDSDKEDIQNVIQLYKKIKSDQKMFKVNDEQQAQNNQEEHDQDNLDTVILFLQNKNEDEIESQIDLNEQQHQDLQLNQEDQDNEFEFEVIHYVQFILDFVNQKTTINLEGKQLDFQDFMNHFKSEQIEIVDQKLINQIQKRLKDQKLEINLNQQQIQLLIHQMYINNDFEIYDHQLKDDNKEECQVSNIYCETCFNNHKCYECKDGYTPYGHYNYCIKQPIKNDPYCAIAQYGKCILCSSGFQILNDSCQKTQLHLCLQHNIHCQDCEEYDYFRCKKCKQGYKIYGVFDICVKE